MKNLGYKKGFTLVELSLSVAFISILSITIALITTNAISTYRRGMTLNQVNTVGMDLVDDMMAAIQNSPARAVYGECFEKYSGSSLNGQRHNCENDGARLFVAVKRMAEVSDVGVIPVFGAFCSGSYSYVWNSGYFYGENTISNVSKAIVKYNNTNYENFRLIKVKDKNREACISMLTNDKYELPSSGIGNIFNINSDSAEEPEIVLSESETNSLAIYDLSSMAPATNDLSSASFYSVSFILGTIQGGINIRSTGNFCKTPSDSTSSFDYCAINKFNFAAQAIGG